MTTSRPQTVSPLWLWFGMLAAPITWFVYLSVVYSVVDFSCHLGYENHIIGGFNSTLVIVVVATLVALIISVVGAGIAFINHRKITHRENTADTTHDRRRFMALVGTAMSILFSVVIVLTGLPVFFLSPCEGIIG